MARTPEIDRVKQDQRQCADADKIFKEWSDKYKCDQLEDYYYGHQAKADDGYVINMFYPSVNIAKPSMMFQLPKYKVTARPNRSDDPMSDVEMRAKLQEYTLNTFVQDPDLGFETEVGLAITEAFFRFGVVQVGYTADFIDNPNADRPMLKDGTNDPMLDSTGHPVMQPRATLTNESLFLKWIHAKQVRVSSRSTNRTSACDWVAYFEWHYPADLKANKKYKNTKDIQPTGRLKGERERTGDGEESRPGMAKVWFKWDLRAKQKRVFAEGAEKYFLEEPFEFLPFAVLKFDEILGQWLPLPPTYNWKPPQDELNDTREMQRIHRKRAKRFYGRRPSVTEDEFNKLLSGEDMTCIVMNNPETDIAPIKDAPLDPAVARNIPQSQDDFQRISGISGEAQQVAQSETATQANLIALASKVREASRRVVVGKFLNEIGRIILMTIRANMALPVWIQKAVDPTSPMAVQEAQEVAYLWEQISNKDLGEIDNDITVDLSSMSPIAQEQERDSWLAFLQIMTSPAIGTMLAVSPPLMEKTAGLFNIHSDRDLQNVGQALQMMAMLQAQQAMGGGAPGGKPGEAAPGPTPSNADITAQLTEQLPVEATQ